MKNSNKLIIQPNNDVDKLQESKTVTWRLCFASFVAVIGLVEFGWNVGVINTPQAAIKQFINDTFTSKDSQISDSSIKMLFAIIVSTFFVGGLFGALVAGWLANTVGRRDGMLMNNLMMIVGGLLMSTGRYAWSYEMIIIGRLLAGFSSGIYTGLVSLYLNEIAPVQIRGIFGLMFQLSSVIGLFLSQVFGLTIIMGNTKYWHILLGLVIIPSIIQASLLKLCPRSPKFLLFVKKDEIAAEKVLRALRPPSYDIHGELEEMKMEFESLKNVDKVGIFGILHSKTLRTGLAVCVVLHVSQQLTGINNIFFYSSTLFESVGVSKANSEYSTMAVGAIMIIMTLVSCPMIEGCGRRILLIGGLFGCLCSSTCFTIFYTFQKTVPGFNYLSVVSALSLVASFGIGPGSIPWLVIPEIMPVSCLSVAISISIPANWLMNLVVGLIFPSIHDALQNLIFTPFIACLFVATVFLYRFMPETKVVKVETTIDPKLMESTST